MDLLIQITAGLLIRVVALVIRADHNACGRDKSYKGGESEDHVFVEADD
jgi:hypothetical protein